MLIYTQKGRPIPDISLPELLQKEIKERNDRLLQESKDYKQKKDSETNRAKSHKGIYSELIQKMQVLPADVIMTHQD
jgi:hypothetical protein